MRSKNKLAQINFHFHTSNFKEKNKYLKNRNFIEFVFGMPQFSSQFRCRRTAKILWSLAIDYTMHTKSSRIEEQNENKKRKNRDWSIQQLKCNSWMEIVETQQWRLFVIYDTHNWFNSLRTFVLLRFGIDFDRKNCAHRLLPIVYLAWW